MLGVALLICYLGVAASAPRHEYGYYMQVYGNPAMVKSVLEQVRDADPTGPIFVVSDAGLNFSAMARHFGARFIFKGHNQHRSMPILLEKLRGDGVPYLRRIGSAMRACDCRTLVLLEEDTCMHRKPRTAPRGDVGGVPWNDLRKFGNFTRALQTLGVSSKAPPWGFASGVCGGGYYNVNSMLALPEFANGTVSRAYEVLRSTIRGFGGHLGEDLLAPALAYATGRSVVPWEELSELGKVFDGSRGPRRLRLAERTALEHKCRWLLDIRKAGAQLDPEDAWMAQKPNPQELQQLPADALFSLA